MYMCSALLFSNERFLRLIKSSREKEKANSQENKQNTPEVTNWEQSRLDQNFYSVLQSCMKKKRFSIFSQQQFIALWHLNPYINDCSEFWNLLQCYLSLDKISLQ